MSVRSAWAVPAWSMMGAPPLSQYPTSCLCGWRQGSGRLLKHQYRSRLSHPSFPQPQIRASASSPPPSLPEENCSAPAQRITLFWRGVELATSLFPVWVALGSVIAFLYPPSFLWFQPHHIVFVLAFIMTGMGLAIEPEDFGLVLSKPIAVLLGVLAQYCIMPCLGLLLGRYFGLPSELAVGLILVSVCPGGAASNLVCLVGKADVALSVVLTLCSTLLSVIMIPTLMKVLAGSIVHISAFPLLVSTAQVVLAPLLVGSTLKRLSQQRRFSVGPIKNRVDDILRLIPLVSVTGITLICGSVVARASGTTLSPLLVAAIALLHGLGGFFGFFVSKLFRLPKSSCRTVSIGT